MNRKSRTSNSIEKFTPSPESRVDFRVEGKRGRSLWDIPFWNKVLYVLLVIIIIASFSIIAFQFYEISILYEQNTNLQTTNTNLRATIEALQKLLTATPTP